MIPKVIHYCWFGGNPKPENCKKVYCFLEKILSGLGNKRME